MQSLFSHSEISRRNKMKRTHYANTTKMTAEAASVRVVSDYILPNCSRNVYSIQFYQLMNIFLDLRTFYQYFPLNRVLLQRLPHITGTCCKRNLISTRAWAIEKLLREIEITLLSL